jgi:hypothetical protein
MPSRLVALIALLCLSSALHAQTEAPARYQIYGGYAFLSNTLNGVPGSHQPLNGWDAAAAFAPWHGLRFKLDVSDYRGTNLGAPQHLLFILAGGQFSRRFGRESAFVEGLVGAGGANKTWPAEKAIGQTASFSSLVGGGLDTRLTRHIAYRVSGGYQYSYFVLEQPTTLVPYRIPGLPTNFARISSGLVWQFQAR